MDALGGEARIPAGLIGVLPKMTTPRPAPRDAEREFRIEQIFFSATDSKGIITGGNATFAEIAAYELSELVGEPHNIIRHPDMPRAVFELLWTRIRAGQPVAAYVKNLARDGAFYWVMALVLPIEGGYLSLRIKPSSAIFKAIPQLYVQLLAREAEVEKATGKRKESIAAGVEALSGALVDLGLGAYESFMWTALRAEMSSREASLSDERPLVGSAALADRHGTAESVHTLSGLRDRCDSVRAGLTHLFSALEGLSALNDRLGEESGFVRTWAQSIRMMALNAQIQSAQLAHGGEALGVVAEWIGRTSQGASESMERFDRQALRLSGPLTEAIACIITGKLEIEVVRDFLDEMSEDPDLRARDLQLHPALTPAEANCATLLRSFLENMAGLRPALAEVGQELPKLVTEVQEIAKHVRTLELIPLTGKVEAAREENARSFVTIFDTLADRVEETRLRLEVFEHEIATQLERQTDLDQVVARLEFPAREIRGVAVAA